jgi:hypothetical protein
LLRDQDLSTQEKFKKNRFAKDIRNSIYEVISVVFLEVQVFWGVMQLSWASTQYPVTQRFILPATSGLSSSA